MEASLHHGKFVIASGGAAAGFYVMAEQVRSFYKLLLCNSQVRQLQQRFRVIGIGMKRLLKKGFGGRIVSLALFDVAHIKQAGIVMRILLEALLEIFFGFVEATEMPVGESHESVRSRRRIQADQYLESIDGLLGFS